MDNMLSVADVLRVSPRPTSFSDFNELDWKLTNIARTFNNFKRALRPTSDQPGRSTKRQRLLTDMPREGNLSPSRRSTTPGKSSKGTSDKTPSSSAREKTAGSSSRDGKQGRDRSAKPSPVAVAPSPTDLPSGGAPSHQSASRHRASPLPSVGRLRMNSPETSAFVQARIHQRRVELINKLMAALSPWIDKSFDALEAAIDGGGNQPGHAGTKRGSGLISSSASGGGTPTGHKRGKGDECQESDGDNDGDQRRGGRTTKRTKTTTERNKKFACPYYKRDPIKHAHSRTCSGPGWDEVHRMKEHLYRRHELPRAKCHRCYEYFHEERDLEDHLRMDVPCIIRGRGTIDPIQGFDEKQRNALKSNKKPKLTEVERWKEVYSILFRIPIDSPEMPSPFYEDSDVNRAAPTTESNSKDVKACLNYCRREAPKAIRQAVEAYLDREFGMVEERVKTGLVSVVETSLVKVFTTWQSVKPPDEISSMPDPNSPVAGRKVGEVPRSPSPSPVAQPDVASMFHNFFTDDNGFAASLDFNNLYPDGSFQQGELANMCHQSLEVDSGYHTYPNSDGSNPTTELLTTPAYGSRRIHRY